MIFLLLCRKKMKFDFCSFLHNQTDITHSMLHNLYIFSREGNCIFYREWNRTNRKQAANPDEEYKLICGLVLSMSRFSENISPDPFVSCIGCSYDVFWWKCSENERGFHLFRTNNISFHFLDSPSGIRIVIIADVKTPYLENELWKVYCFFVEIIVRNPTWRLGSEVIDPKFIDAIDTMFCHWWMNGAMYLYYVYLYFCNMVMWAYSFLSSFFWMYGCVVWVFKNMISFGK